MNHPSLRRRAVGVVAVTAVAATAITGLTATGANAAEPAGISVDAGATWLASQLDGGLIHNDQYDFDDLGLSADVAFGLDAVGGNDATVAAIAAAIEPRAQAEWYTSSFEGVTTTYGGSLAKALVLAQAAGSDPTDFGGADLVEGLEARVAGTGAIVGRVRDENNAFGDTNVIGQAFAAQGLDTAGSEMTNSVTEFLLAQQCTNGYFRLNPAAADAPEQGCVDDDAEGSAPDTDATALAVLALTAQSDDADVDAALDQATDWLQETQGADGSFGGGTSTEAPNANSTGLAGWALGERGLTAPATKAAAWVRSVQAGAAAPCASKVPAGAIAYDKAALATGLTDGITTETQDQWRRSTAQALPALQWAPSGPAVTIAKPKGFFKAGSLAPISAAGLPPGATVCFVVGTSEALALVNPAGRAAASIRLPAGTANRSGRIAIFGTTVASGITYQVLGPKKLKVDVQKARVGTGGKQVIKISKLAPREEFKLVVGGSNSSEGVGGRASAKGTYVFRLSAGKPGTYKVKAVGEFGTRKGAASYVVVR
jgi:hypothetical protein